MSVNRPTFNPILQSRNIQDKIVLDLGSCVIRIGFSGEATPRAIYRTSDMGLGDGKDIILLSKAIRMILRGLVSADSKPRNWVICDNPHSSIAGKNLLAAVLFQELKASTVSFVPTPFLALFASGATASLVVDVGYKSTTVVPIFDNRCMFTSVSSVGLGSADVCARILESLDDESRTTLEENPKLCKMFFDHAQHCCFVSQRQMVPNDFAIPTDSKAIDFDIQLDEHVKVLLSGNMREYAADVLFEHKYDESVTGAMLDCLMKCPQDIRKQLISNIILVGGSSMLPGIKSRILSQVLALCEHIEKYRSLLSLHKDAKFVALAFNSDICAWVGASLIGNSQIKTAFDINASDFDSDNSVPDWTRMQYENEAQR